MINDLDKVINFRKNNVNIHAEYTQGICKIHMVCMKGLQCVHSGCTLGLQSVHGIYIKNTRKIYAINLGEKNMISAEKEMAPLIGANHRLQKNYDYHNQNGISGKDFIATLTKKFQAFLGQPHSSLEAFSKEGK